MYPSNWTDTAVEFFLHLKGSGVATAESYGVGSFVSCMDAAAQGCGKENSNENAVPYLDTEPGEAFTDSGVAELTPISAKSGASLHRAGPGVALVAIALAATLLPGGG